MSERLKRMRDDAGAMLIFALIVITVVALVTGAVLTHGFTNFRATVALRGVAGTSYAADTAGKVAINNLRLGARAPGWVAPTFPGAWANWVYTNNADGTGCFGVTPAQAAKHDLMLSNVYPAAGSQTAASSARVECTPVPGTGIFGGGTGVVIDDPDPTDAFARALTTIGTGTLNGMTLKPVGDANFAPMPMRGGVASRTFIDVSNGALVTDGVVQAQGTCTAARIVGASVTCNAPGSVPIPDPEPSPVSSVPAYRDADSMGCNFLPGFYNNAAELSTATNNCAVARFAPGQYYFDFRDEDHGLPNEWTITTKVIGGVSSGNDTIPGACLSPITNVPVVGVQFVFGHTSRMRVENSGGSWAQVELCGPSNGGAAPMTLFQQETGASLPPQTITDRAPDVVIQSTGPKIDPFVVVPTGTTLKDAVAAADASSLTWTAANNNRTAGIDIRDFGLGAIPAGADITSASLEVKYTKVSSKNLTVNATGETPVVIGAPNPSGWGSADLTTQMRNLIEDGAFTANRPRLEIRLDSAAKLDTLTIDAVRLNVTYTEPSLRAASDVTFLSTKDNYAGKFVVQGATYIPHGYAAMNPGNSSVGLVAFRWGILALGVDFKAQPQQLFGYPLVSIPDAGTGFGGRITVVDLEIYVCVESADCTTGGAHALNARVMITDPPYDISGTYNGMPEPGRRQIKVLSWAEQN